MKRVLEKVERRLGERMFLKGTRCAGPKCAAVRRGYPPGVRGKKSRRRNASEYASLIREKQKVRYSYGLDDGQIQRYSAKAARMPGVFAANFLGLVERRLDNIIFRLGFTDSRRNARQAINHRHVLVNGRALNIPSYLVRVGDAIALKPAAYGSHHFAELDTRLKRRQALSWLTVDAANRKGAVVALPESSALQIEADVTKVKEFYSR